MPSQVSAEDLPKLFMGLPNGVVQERPVEFVALTSDGRVNAELHRLYSTEQTGPNGPAAAIVRYLPGAKAQPHRHPGYELIYILRGELETADGVYGPNSLLVMPPGSTHAPRSPQGCVALVVWEQPVKPA